MNLRRSDLPNSFHEIWTCLCFALLSSKTSRREAKRLTAGRGKETREARLGQVMQDKTIEEQDQFRRQKAIRGEIGKLCIYLRVAGSVKRRFQFVCCKIVPALHGAHSGPEVACAKRQGLQD